MDIDSIGITRNTNVQPFAPFIENNKKSQEGKHLANDTEFKLSKAPNTSKAQETEAKIEFVPDNNKSIFQLNSLYSQEMRKSSNDDIEKEPVQENIARFRRYKLDLAYNSHKKYTSSYSKTKLYL
jgi:hypothetical protein